VSLVACRTVISGSEVRKGRTVASPPAAPGTLTATAGDGQASLSWVASATSGVTYLIKRVNQDTVVATTAAGVTTKVITGLTNGVTYNFQVYAVGASGAVSSPSNVGTAVPAPAGSTGISTYWGYNSATATDKGDRSIDSMTGKKAKLGNRAPVVRVYGSSGLQRSFTPTTTTCPEKRVVYSYKAGGSWSETELANGAAIGDMIAWLQDIPAGWIVFWVYHHEPNSPSVPGGMEVDPTNFVNTYHQMRLALNAATLATGVKVYITCNFMDYQTAGGTHYPTTTSTWSDTWVPSRSDCDLLTFDAYGNPGQNTSASGSNKYGGPATGSAYDTTYPLPSVRYANMFQVIERCGYADAWGILEVNSPLRNWDTNEAGRVAWHQDTIALFLTPPMTGSVPPKVFLMWEGVSGVNWNQGYGQNTHPAKNGHYSPYTDGSGSPLWAVWSPYMTAMPTTG